MARILVTGANGFVGRALVPRLVAAGHRVVGIVRAKGEDGSVAIGDIALYGAWPSLLAGIDVVVHLAARAHVLREEAPDPLAEFRRVNTTAVRDLATAAAAAGVGRFVLLSSIGVNGVRTEENAFSESDKPNPTEPYAVSKWEAECALLDIGARSRMQITRVRPPLIVGPGAKGNLRRLLNLVDSGMLLPLGGIRNQRSFIALDDLCELLATCVSHGRAGNELFLAADLRTMSTPELLGAMADGLGRVARIVSVPMPLLESAAGLFGRRSDVQRMAWSLCVNASRARDLLGWTAACGLGQGIRAMTAHYLQETRV